MPSFSNEQRAAIAIGVPVVALLLYLWYRRRQNSESLDEDDDYTQVEESDVVASSNQRTVEVKVPRAVVGAIIGKSGANIKKIEKDSGARLNLKDDNEEDENAERIVLIQGEREKAKRAEILVKKIIAEQPVIKTENIFVPQRACGRIIGKGGQTIRHMCTVSGARIRIDRENEDLSSPLRQCTVTGTSDQISMAKGLLDEKIAEDKESWLRSGDIGMPRNRRAPRKLDTALASPITGAVQFPKTDDFFEVFVSAIDNPGHFWVQLLSKDSPDLDKLTNDLTMLYLSSESNAVFNAFKVGDICCAPFEHDSSWYRARILEIHKDGIVDLFYVDFGDSGKISKEKLRELKQEHDRLPFQAIECYLAGVKPKDDEWSRESTDDFERLSHCTQWVSLMAQVVKYSGDIPCLELIDTTGKTDVNINEEMINNQFAVCDVSCTADEQGLVSELVQDAKRTGKGLQEMPIEINQNSAEHQEITPPGADNGDINGETPKHDTQTIQAQNSSDVLSNPASNDFQDGSPLPDVTDSGPELHGPVTPESDSPVKAALVKTISRDYISPPVNSSPDVPDEGRAALGVVQEQELMSVSESTLQSQPEAPNSTDHNIEELHATSPEKIGYRSSLNIAASSKRTMAATFSGSRPVSERSEVKTVTSTVHRQVVSTKQSYVSSMTLPERDTDKVIVSVSPSAVQLQGESPFELESHAFKSSNESTTLTRHMVASEVHRTVTQSNGRDTTNKFTSSRVEEKAASYSSSPDEKPKVTYEINFESNQGMPGAEQYTIKKTFNSLESVPHASLEALDSDSSGVENGDSTAAASTAARKEGSMQSGNSISRGWAEGSSGDMSPSGSLLDIAKNTVIDEEEEYEEEDQQDTNNSKLVESESPEPDSDTESFMSAREDITSDTDTAAYMTAATEGSSTSLDTDPALVDNPADETITPVNSDTEVEYEEEAEETGHEGPVTPQPGAEAGKDRSRSGTLKGLKEQMTLLGGVVTSDGDLGYRGDTEEGLASAEDLRTAGT